MKPNQDYLDSIAKKLDSMNALGGGKGGDQTSNREPDTYKLPSLMDQMGMTAQKYLDDKKKNQDNQ